MTSLQFERLTDNLRRDGVLTSVPLVYDIPGDDSGKLVILSGNQRVDAAKAADLEEIDIIEIVTRVPEDRRTAIALSHNAITGQDDPNLLRAFYDSLALALKEYSGLTDDMFKAAKLDVTLLTVKKPEFETVILDFLPENKEVFLAVIKRIKNSRIPPTVLVGRFEDFDAFFDATMKTKAQANVHNAAMALRIMAELAVERLNQIETESASTRPVES